MENLEQFGRQLLEGVETVRKQEHEINVLNLYLTMAVWQAGFTLPTASAKKERVDKIREALASYRLVISYGTSGIQLAWNFPDRSSRYISSEDELLELLNSY